MKRLLIRADDLGFSEGINYGIAKTVKDGIIRSVGLMTNMPAAEHGYGLIKECGVCIGQHTNICIGQPLTDPERIPSIVGENGEFKPSSEYRAAEKDFVVLEEVILEIEAQYERFCEITGKEPQYFEGHAVASANFFKGLEVVAERHHLDYLAFPAGNSPVKFAGQKLYVYMDSMKDNYDPFASLKNCMEHAHKDGIEMFVCHPGYLDGYVLKKSSLTIPRVLEADMACSKETFDYLMANHVQIVSYTDLKRYGKSGMNKHP